jgi:hypothetical protein
VSLPATDGVDRGEGGASAELGHSSIKITSDIYSSVTAEVAHDAAERTAAIVPRRARAVDSGVPTLCPAENKSGGVTKDQSSIAAGQTVWGGSGLNPGPTDYE